MSENKYKPDLSLIADFLKVHEALSMALAVLPECSTVHLVQKAVSMCVCEIGDLVEREVNSAVHQCQADLAESDGEIF